MSAEKMLEHRWSFSGKGQNIIACSLHEGERQVLKPQEREAVLRMIVEAGEWDGPLLDVQTEVTADVAPALPPTQAPAVRQPSPDVVSYESFAGQQVELSVKMIQQMLCPEANPAQALYMQGWCAHNRIDPFGMEAHFSIIQDKPIIQVSKDCWFRRMEGHPAFDKERSGIRVDTTMDVLKEALLAYEENDYPYHISQLLKDKLIKDIEDDHASAPKGMPARITVKKDGFHLDEREHLIGGWARITRKDRPNPYNFEPDVEGWKSKKKDGSDNHFWAEKGGKRPFMIWKTARKNCVRLAFPELSGLIRQPEIPGEDDVDMEMAPSGEWQVNGRIQDNREVHRLAGLVSEPVGPLDHDDLHTLSGILYGVETMRDLTWQDMRSLKETIAATVDGDAEIYRCIGEDLGKLPLAQEETTDEQIESPDGTTAGAEPVDAEWSDTDEIAEPA